MFESDPKLKKIVEYMKMHWPSKVREEWQVSIDKYPEILKKVLSDLIQEKTKNKNFIRIAGVSGSGKTSQLIPAANAYFEKTDSKPILVAARIFVPYHPFYNEIKNEYGEENIRKMTDEFSTIMMFLTLKTLINEGYDLILDVTLLDPLIEGMLTEMLNSENYNSTMLMIAISPEVSEKFLGDRAWRHTRETELEFIRATKLAMEFYANNFGDMRIVIWNVFDANPVYDGGFKDAVPVWQKYSEITEIPEHDADLLREAKIKYLTA